MKEVFDKIRTLRVGVIGDFAVDFYFDLIKNTGEISLETGQEVWWGSRPRTSLGAAGNVVQNLAALGVGFIKVFGAVGRDVYGREMLDLLQKLDVDTAGISMPGEGWDTCVYTKPLQKNVELNRLDFGTHNCLSDEKFEEILTSLESQMADLDVLIINQQFPAPLLTGGRVALLNKLIVKYPSVFVLADMRTFGLALRGVTLKVNTEELARLLQVEGYEKWAADECTKHGRQLAQIIDGPVLITHGEHGMYHVSEKATYHSEALRLDGELDTVGAGDTAVAAFAASAGAKISVEDALKLANFAAAVTVQKKNQTGTATPEEVMRIGQSTLFVNS